MIKTVLLFRHGETDWNQRGRFQGQTDVPLNATGVGQSRALVRELSDRTIDAVLTSDLSRALETARFVAHSKNAPLIVNPLLREADLGEAEGLTREEVIQRFGEPALQRWANAADLEFRFEKGESKLEHQQRLFRCLEFELRLRPGTCFGVCSHGGAIRRILHHLDPKNDKPFPIPNCALFEFHFDLQQGRWSRPVPIGKPERNIRSK